mmetsp:Transcript_8675/g.18870  ORF Transcript_8675/g.18870 Transcript_8675/m.18870 type:complete len:81 (+) Transcript_8675:99-341(+)
MPNVSVALTMHPQAHAAVAVSAADGGRKQRSYHVSGFFHSKTASCATVVARVHRDRHERESRLVEASKVSGWWWVRVGLC